jgi:Putative Ig domain
LRLIRAICAPLLLSFALAGCGGGEGDSVNPVAGAATADEVGTTATATISGTPMTAVTVGTNYSFTPTASDSDGGKLTFAIQNAPAWATFNTSTGQLSGSPKVTDTGTTANIVITAADGAATAALAAFSITVTATTASSPSATTGTATLSWVAPVENSNGTTLTNLAGYKIYYGTDSQSLNQVVQVSSPATLSYVISGLASGTWYFAVAAYTSAGEESALSTISTKTIG